MICSMRDSVNESRFIIKQHKRNYEAALAEIEGDVPTFSQFWLLDALEGSDSDQNQVNLAKKTLCDTPTMTRIIDLCQRKGWVERVMNKSDRRSFNIVLTHRGKDVYERIVDAIDSQSDMAEPLSLVY